MWAVGKKYNFITGKMQYLNHCKFVHMYSMYIENKMAVCTEQCGENVLGVKKTKTF